MNHCQACNEELTYKAVSDDFCGERCQINWTRRFYGLPSLDQIDDPRNRYVTYWGMLGVDSG